MIKRFYSVITAAACGAGLFAIFYYSDKAKNTLGVFYWVVVGVLAFCLLFSVGELLIKTKDKRLSDNDGSGIGEQSSSDTSVYEKKAAYSACERDFYNLLREAVSNKHDIMRQVPLTAVIDKRSQNAYRSELFKTVDFCIINPKNAEPLVLIELNDRSHLKPERIERDKKVAQLADAAKIPLVTFWTNENFTVEGIRKTLKKYL